MNLIIMIHQVNWLKETWIEAFYPGCMDDSRTKLRSVVKSLCVQPYPGMTIGCMNGGAPPTAACAAADCDAAC